MFRLWRKLDITKLLVLDRTMDFSKLKDANSSRWTFFARALVGFVVVGNVICIVGNIVASVFFHKGCIFMRFSRNNEQLLRSKTHSHRPGVNGNTICHR